MEQLVIVRAETNGRYSAEAVGFPDLRADADTEEAAVEKVRQALADKLAGGKLVRVTVPVNGQEPNPWLKWFGRSANDPEFPAYLEELQKARAADPIE